MSMLRPVGVSAVLPYHTLPDGLDFVALEELLADSVHLSGSIGKPAGTLSKLYFEPLIEPVVRVKSVPPYRVRYPTEPVVSIFCTKKYLSVAFWKRSTFMPTKITPAE